MSHSVYLDFNATAPVRPEAMAAMLDVMEHVGNASSVHAAGRAAHARLEEARESLAALVGARAQDLTFTSGGSEANTLAIQNAVLKGTRRLIVGATEHASVMEASEASGAAVELWPVDGRGLANLDWLKDRLNLWGSAEGAPFVALMLANNETGVIQPVAETAALVREAGGWLHVDAVQATGKIEVDFKALGADTMAVSAHKIGGPQGSGALIAKGEREIVRRAFGGGQERGRRGGTENLPGAVGFGAAAKKVASVPRVDHAEWRDQAVEQIRKHADIVVLGEDAPRLGNTLCFACPGFSSELQLMALDLAGVMVSAGSACSSGKVKASHVIAAMGHEDLGTSVIRVSSGWRSMDADWDRFADVWTHAHARHAKRGRKLVEA